MAELLHFVSTKTVSWLHKKNLQHHRVRIDIVAPLGLWWVCKLGAAAKKLDGLRGAKGLNKKKQRLKIWIMIRSSESWYKKNIRNGDFAWSQESTAD